MLNHLFIVQTATHTSRKNDATINDEKVQTPASQYGSFAVLARGVRDCPASARLGICAAERTNPIFFRRLLET